MRRGGQPRQRSPLTILGDHAERIRKLEFRAPPKPGHWIYVGDYPTDPDTTPDSTPFENGVTNAGGGLRRLRYRASIGKGIDVEGSVAIPAVATYPVTVTTIVDPDLIPDETDVTIGTSAEDGAAIWKLDTDGSLIVVVASLL